MEKFILDTNLFFNMEAGLGLGGKTEEVIMRLTEIIKILKNNKKAEFYTSPRIVEEILSFFENKNQSFIQDFLSVINIKTPDYTKIQFSAGVFYKLIKDIRGRSYRGLNIAEEEVAKAGKIMNGSEILSKKDFEIKIGSVVKTLRDRYRQATRVGFLDSVADLDLIVLAKELDGFLVSTDEGVVYWARVFAVKEMPAAVFAKRLQFLSASE